MRKIKLLLLFVLLFVLGSGVSSAGYMDDMLKKAEFKYRIENRSPLTEEEEAVLDRIQRYEDSQRKIFEEEEKRLDANPELRKQLEEEDKKYRITEEDWKRWSEESEKKIGVKQDTKLETESSYRQVSNRQKAVNYALNWSSNKEELRNSQYPSFYNDCTNFVSQVLEAGGRSQVSGGSRKVASWFMSNGWFWGFNYSHTWTVADMLKKHLSQSNDSERITDFSELEVGDIIFFDWGGLNGTKMDHSVVVTQVDDTGFSNIYVSAHTSDRHNISLKDLYKIIYKMDNVGQVSAYLFHMEY